MNQWRKILLMAALGLAASLLVIGLGCYAIWTSIAGAIDSSTCPPENPGQIEIYGRFTYPPSARVIDSACIVWQGYSVWTHFEMAPEDLDQFVASTALDGPLLENHLPSDVTPPFNREPLSPYLYGEITEEQGFFRQKILIETGDPGRYVVYLETSGE